MGNLKKLFGQKLRLIRKEKGITQEELGKLIDIQQRQLTRIECGQNFPSADTLEKICYYLDTPIHSFFDFKVEEEQLQMTGTDNNIIYKAVKSGNIVMFEFSGNQNLADCANTQNQEIPYPDSDEEMLKIAQKNNKPITVEYFENGVTSKITIYFPDGSLKNIRQNNYSPESAIKKITTMLKPISKNQIKMEFVELAINALNNPQELEKFKVIINDLVL